MIGVGFGRFVLAGALFGYAAWLVVKAVEDRLAWIGG